ncbi:hypothetical protein [Ostreibacterium oceani]|nr:hypothetical protein [Ostreibacterium oceani]
MEATKIRKSVAFINGSAVVYWWFIGGLLVVYWWFIGAAMQTTPQQ